MFAFVLDADGDVIAYQYEWYQNGAITNYSTATIAASSTVKGDIWTVHVTPNDGYVDGLQASASVAIENTPPQISSLLISPSLPANDELLTCSANIFDPDESTTDMYYWYDASSGALLGTGATLDLSSFGPVPGTSVQCVLEAMDGSGAMVSDQATVVVQNQAPVVSGVVISGARAPGRSPGPAQSPHVVQGRVCESV